MGSPVLGWWCPEGTQHAAWEHGGEVDNSLSLGHVPVVHWALWLMKSARDLDGQAKALVDRLRHELDPRYQVTYRPW
ncbi:MAG: hypothetical protein JHC95_14120 [Solirubrobacteraceae bacterium]|nr:hypothetical protein [Solirubrobacteraceae bacterium]